MSEYGSQDVKCPFYSKETKNTIKCEGVFCESCVYIFFSAIKKRSHKRQYCNTHYENCPHYADVIKKYP